jgi:hypothetical protein
MAKANEEKALTVSNYAVMQHSIDDLKFIITANIGTADLGPADLDRIKVPAGGGTTWEIPGLEGDISTKQLDGVICAWELPRVYWTDKFSDTGGGTPPDCSSPDGIAGEGDPGGVCAACPNAEWGTATNDKGEPTDGQACQQRRMMAIVRPDGLIPVLLNAPATSLGNMKKYFLRLASAGVPFYGVVTRFTLVKAKSKSGIVYSEIEANSIEKLPEDERKKMEGYAKVMGAALERHSASQEDYSQ